MIENLPSKKLKNIWQHHFGASIKEIDGEFNFLYYNQLPRIAYIRNGNKDAIKGYFLDKNLFIQPPIWVINSNDDSLTILKYMNDTYSVHLNEIDWDEVKHSRPIQITENLARIIVKGICNRNSRWLFGENSELSKAAIRAIPRIFPESTTLIYELIQNAFDAKATSVKIEINKKSFNFYHDGNNFTESDTNAISFVNLSIKDKDKVGFMGIGFKSAFEASHRPEIHSSPFHFRFDSSTEGGLILPKFIKPKNINKPFSTLIHIPFKSETEYQTIKNELVPRENLESKIGFSKKTFLHLVKEKTDGVLDGITKVETPYTDFRIERGELFNSFIIKDENDQQELWLRFEREIRPDPNEIKNFLDARQIKNEELEKEGWNEIVSLLIPVEYKDTNYQPNLKYNGELNAYLPTKIMTNLNFDVQGNFIVNATRNQLKQISGDWNRALFKQIGSLLIDILEWCKSHRTDTEINILSFYDLIPDWNKIDFLPEDVLDEIKSLFSLLFNSKALIPTGTQKIRFEKASNCIIVDNLLIDLFGKKTIEYFTGKKIVHVNLSDFARGVLKDNTNIDEFDFYRLTDILSKRDWFNRTPKLVTRQAYNKWLSKLYSYLNENLPTYVFNEDYQEKINKILNCYIFPIDWSQTENRYNFTKFIFRNKKIYRLKPDQSQLPLSAFQNKIRILNQSFENYIRGRAGKLKEDEKNFIEGSRKLLDKLDITFLEPSTIVKDFFNPLFDDVDNYEMDVIVDYTAFICKHLSDVKRAHLKPNLLLLNKNGKFKKPKELFFGEKFGFSDINKFFGNDKGEIFLSEKYLEKKAISTDEWIDLFTYMGVNYYFPCKTPIKSVYPFEFKKIVSSEFKIPDPRAGYINENFPGDKYLLLDKDFREVVRIRLDEIEELPVKVKKDCMRAFLRILDKNWDKKYSSMLYSKVKYYEFRQRADSYPREKITDSYTKFAKYLLDGYWVPASNSDDLRNPKDVVRATDENISLFDEGVILCEEIIKSQNLTNFLPFQLTPENITSLHRLIHLKNIKNRDLDRYKELYSTIYEDIQNKVISATEIQKGFIENKLVYANADFWSPQEVMFRPPQALQLYLPQLNEIYPDMEDFFCNILGCDIDEPSIDKILHYFMNFLWITDRGMDDNLRASVLFCYRRLLHFINEQDKENYLKAELWNEYINNCKVFCRDTGWVHINTEKPIIYLDIHKYEEKFLNCNKINIESHFRQLNRDTNDLAPLLELLNINSASRAITEEIKTPDKNIYSNTSKIEKNIDILLESIITVLKNMYSDSNKKERTQINRFIEELEEFKRYRKVVYKTTKITSSIFLGGEELFKVNKSCHMTLNGNLLDILVSDQIRLIYGAFSSEFCEVLETNILPGNIERLIQSLIDRNVGNIEDNFKRSLHNFFMEIGFSDNGGTDEVADTYSTDEDDELTDEEIDEDDTSEEDYTSDKENKKKYEELVEPLDYDNMDISTINGNQINVVDDEKTSGNKKRKRRTGRHFTPNTYSQEDGDRGEEIVIKKEKVRLGKIGLDKYISDIYHISQKNRTHPWDIESFDLDDGGNVIPIRIEVKATSDPYNLVFPMSEGELKSALDTDNPKGKYMIYRVFNVRSSNPSIVRYDFYDMFSKKLIDFKNKDFYIKLPESNLNGGDEQ